MMFVEKKVKLYPLHEGKKISYYKACPERVLRKRVTD